ncbi:uncharacterized protein LOC120660819 [Panicum virgatum]|uniref:Uncharacterized protein n=1 Tax=Panicum virgatum TaxID=38727 RepID=A0A8T0VJG1_PANVG|nr:uncharacterized protein LOC120660819 [Panicum virgatum]KAG2635329.1 hypothetical protein PVAP13_2NG343000 [Panicum virgatum]KAG2635330.1 hypothetical protein PVAP13_2NG343000 [Panicum virgatum]
MSAGSERPYAFATPSTVPVGFSRGSGSVAAATDSAGTSSSSGATTKSRKPPFRPATDDTKPVLRDPISRSDPVETEQAVLRLPRFP